MLKSLRLYLLVAAAALAMCLPQVLNGQSVAGSIAGIVKDPGGAVLHGAKVALTPGVHSTTTDVQGDFLIANIAPGQYTMTVTYVGFAPYTTSVTVTGGQTGQVNAVLKVASLSDSVVVTAPRLFGDAEAVNQTVAADNIMQVLPANVITSLPNANVADALERMPGVTVERDEGEAKYVQVRATEPRLTNTMVDGVTIPSSESGVRQIKLDTVPSDLVSEIQVNKTLQANIDGDGIGGSVNLVTKTAQETPTLSLFGSDGYTPIDNGRTAADLGGVIGKRFGPGKKFGALLAGSYNYQGRGIDDVEPSNDPTQVIPAYTAADLRNYVYDRTRWGIAGSTDYNLGNGSNISLRGMFANFRNWGDDYIHSMVDFPSQSFPGGAPNAGQGAYPSMSHSRRRPNMVVATLDLNGQHQFRTSWLFWSAAVSRSRAVAGAQGYGGDGYGWVGDQNLNCHNDQSLATSVYRPGWGGCFGTGLDNAVDRNNYGLTSLDQTGYGIGAQLNLMAEASFGKRYNVGNRSGVFEFGAKVRNAHKFDNSWDTHWYAPTYHATDANGNPVPLPVVNGQTLQLNDGDLIPIPVSAHPEWASNLSNPNYYDKTYPLGTFTDWSKVWDWIGKNPGVLTEVTDSRPNSNNFDLIERIPAGYVMNTFDFTGRVRLVAGLRIEATHVSTTSFDQLSGTLSYKAGGDYTNFLPSASLRLAIDASSDVRLVYGRGVSRPDPQDISAADSITYNQNPVQIGLGNPALKAEMANNIDVLYERTFPHVGLFQAGYFYKNLTDPLVSLLNTTTPSDPRIPAGFKPLIPAGSLVQITQPANAGSAWEQGFELAFQQRLSYLPGVLGGAGISANYAYFGSKASKVDPLRTDTPRLARNAPDAWNIGPTYDTKRFSMRVGMNYEAWYIDAYNYEDLQYVTDSNGLPIIDPKTGKQETQFNGVVGGPNGPAGDHYFYPQFRFDTQATYQLWKGVSIYGYGLNLTNAAFGFYYGSPQYNNQREYYHPTYAGGLRWDLTRER